ncbi:hypothetical protein Q7P37_001442 [Cladosporium fusiforme]
MSDKPTAPPAEGAAAAAPVENAAPKAPAAPKAVPEQNPAFKAMGLPRFRLPSRNWMIFLGITGSFFGAVYYDKWQTKKNRQKWCDLVAHKSEETLDPHSLPRRLTVYLAAPPGDGLRAAREHFHEYVKPVLVAASMDWDVVEGRKEGDVRFKTADRIRRRRKAGGEGEPLEEADLAAEVQKQRFGQDDPTGVMGDIVIGRHTWKEYVRGLHEGWLGPADAPKEPETEQNLGAEKLEATHVSGQSSVGDAAANAATDLASASTTPSDELKPDEPQPQEEKPLEDEPKKDTEEEEKKEPEKPKPRHPPAYIQPEEYSSATLSALTPQTIGPSTAVSFPHLLGFRNTPIRVYRFLNRRVVADDIGRQVASAVLAAHRPYSTTTSDSASFDDASASASASVSEVATVSQHEERSWWKTVHREREPHEESVWIENCVVDERLTGRMNKFELSADEEARASRIGEGKEGAISKFSKDDE